MAGPATDQVRRLCAFFNEHDGPACLEEFIAFTERRIRRGAWCIKRADGSLPGGRLAEDLVHTVIQAILTPPGTKGYRRIPDDVAIDVAMRLIIRSCINHALLSGENTTRIELPESDDGTLFEGTEPFWSPCEEHLSEEDKVHAFARCEAFIALVKKRNQLVHDMLILLRDEGIEKPAVVAKRLSRPIADIYLARRQLGTLIRTFNGKNSR